jgi:pyruvate kinase
MMECGREEAVRRGLAKPGDRIVVTAGLPMHKAGTTNLLQVVVIGGSA